MVERLFSCLTFINYYNVVVLLIFNTIDRLVMVVYIIYRYDITVVSRVRAHGCLNITRDLARMGAYPGYKFHMFVWKLQL